MTRLCLIILFGALVCSCEQNSGRNQNTDLTPSPTATPYAFDGSEFPRPTPTRLEGRFPEPVREILQKAERINLFEIDECLVGQGKKLRAKNKAWFSECKIKRQVDVTDRKLKERLVSELRTAIESHDSGAACFDPHHGIRAEYDGKRVELIICFECQKFQGDSTMGSFGSGISPDFEKFFEQILNRR